MSSEEIKKIETGTPATPSLLEKSFQVSKELGDLVLRNPEAAGTFLALIDRIFLIAKMRGIPVEEIEIESPTTQGNKIIFAMRRKRAN